MRFTYAEAMTDAELLRCRWPRPPRRRATPHDRRRQPDLPQGVRLDVPLHRHRRPRVPRGQGVHRDDGAVRAPRRRDHDAAVHAVRAQAAGPPAGAGRQAGQLDRLPVEQPARPRRRLSPVARGLRRSWACRGSGAASAWTSAWTSCAGSTTGEFFEFHGEFYELPAIKQTPAPTEPIPLLVGGHADAALRRAVRQGRRLDARRRRRRGARPAARPARRDPRGGGRHAATTSRCT